MYFWSWNECKSRYGLKIGRYRCKNKKISALRARLSRNDGLAEQLYSELSSRNDQFNLKRNYKSTCSGIYEYVGRLVLLHSTSWWLTNRARPSPACCSFLGRVSPELMRFPHRTSNPTLNNQRQLTDVRKVTSRIRGFGAGRYFVGMRLATARNDAQTLGWLRSTDQRLEKTRKIIIVLCITKLRY